MAKVMVCLTNSWNRLAYLRQEDRESGLMVMMKEVFGTGTSTSLRKHWLSGEALEDIRNRLCTDSA
ncbi:hypothetical protein NQZ68_008067 [Dissostichus eleginoides]|nr:hypothetical protein NQZ68_008067 [Dissostichus eleginoides]